MTPTPQSLLDILSPPSNEWLKRISRRRVDLPEGVRVVRFGDDDDSEARNPGVAPVKREATAEHG